MNRLAPDPVVLTGDHVSNTPRGQDFAAGAMLRRAEVLRELVCPLRYAVMGNQSLE